MVMPSAHLAQHPWQRNRRLRLCAGPAAARHQPDTGFTVLELLVAAVLCSISLAGVAATLKVATQTSRRGGAQVQLEALIDQDLAAIAGVDQRLSCCPGSCTTDGPSLTAAVADGRCATSTPLDPRYYAPVQAAGATGTAMAAFESACSTGAIATALAAAFPTLPTPQAGSLQRSTPLVLDAAAQRLRWTYTASVDGRQVVQRVVTVVPAAAAWCP